MDSNAGNFFRSPSRTARAFPCRWRSRCATPSPVSSAARCRDRCSHSSARLSPGSSASPSRGSSALRCRASSATRCRGSSANPCPASRRSRSAGASRGSSATTLRGRSARQCQGKKTNITPQRICLNPIFLLYFQGNLPGPDLPACLLVPRLLRRGIQLLLRPHLFLRICLLLLLLLHPLLRLFCSFPRSFPGLLRLPLVPRRGELSPRPRALDRRGLLRQPSGVSNLGGVLVLQRRRS